MTKSDKIDILTAQNDKIIYFKGYTKEESHKGKYFFVFFILWESEVEKLVDISCDSVIYDNAIEMYFHEYFINRGLDITGDGYKRIETNLFQAAFRYVYKKLFKPDEGSARKYGTVSKIDYDDAYTLNQIVNAYCDIVMAYNIKATQNMFCDLTGISRDTLHSWEVGNTRAYIYYDEHHNIIKDIQEYKLNNRGLYTRELSTTHSDLVKKIKSISHMTAYNGLNDTPVGQITHANNSVEAGMEYNNKRQIETARVQLLTAAELPKLTAKS